MRRPHSRFRGNLLIVIPQTRSKRVRIDAEAIDECIRARVKPEPFSGVVHLAGTERVLFESSYGLAIRSESIPNRMDTRFQTASGCKIFTGTAICQLVERGDLKFDTRLLSCVDGEFPDYDPGITIHHLLTHTSGITSYFEEDLNNDYEALWQDIPMYKIREPRDFLPLFQNKPMKFPPGQRFDYNDGGYILPGLVVESVTGMGFAEYTSKHVFAPAGMNGSGYFLTDQLPERIAYAYIRNEDGTWRTNFFAVPIMGAPDGGAYTTAPDMARFWSALRGNRLLAEPMTTSMLHPHVATSHTTPYSHYGYGAWIDQRDSVVRKYFVEGSDPGVALRSAVYPQEQLTLTMIGNTGGALWPLYRSIEEKMKL